MLSVATGAGFRTICDGLAGCSWRGGEVIRLGRSIVGNSVPRTIRYPGRQARGTFLSQLSDMGVIRQPDLEQANFLSTHRLWKSITAERETDMNLVLLRPDLLSADSQARAEPHNWLRLALANYGRFILNVQAV